MWVSHRLFFPASFYSRYRKNAMKALSAGRICRREG